jgi:hypothetical protein
VAVVTPLLDGGAAVFFRAAMLRVAAPHQFACG